MVEHAATGAVVGTYRMQTGARAARELGYYCAQEFDFSIYEPYRGDMLELGRACIAKAHRSLSVISLLWRGIADYAGQHGARYLVGCSSLTSQDPVLGRAASLAMQKFMAPAAFQTSPLQAYCLPLAAHDPCVSSEAPKNLPTVHLPKLLSAYLALGAWICGPPALDRRFGTIDFLTCMDLQSPDMASRRRRFGLRS
jgi:putative hemolysin